MKAIIPTGGRGTRMQPLTFSSNKHFIPVANKPLIFYPVEAVADAGIKDVAITYNPGWLDVVRNFLGDGSRWGLKFTYVLQEKPLGLANIFQICEKHLAGSPFVLHLGDNIFTEGIKEPVKRFLKEKPNAMLLMVHHKDNTRLGVPSLDGKGNFVRYLEKPKDPPNDYGIPGLYFFDKNVFRCFRGKDKIKSSARGEYEISEPYNWLLDHGYKVLALEYRGRWMDPGKFDDWIEANQYILDNKLEMKMESDVSSDSVIENRVSVGKNCKIEKSRIRGPLIIGDNVTIKDSYIGPYTSISDDCYIEGSHVENSVLMQGVRIIGVKKPIDTSLIGRGTEIFNSNGPAGSMEFFVGEKSKIYV